MWQTVLVLFLLVVVLLYVIRHYVKISRSGFSVCSGCTGCSGYQTLEKKEPCPTENHDV